MAEIPERKGAVRSDSPKSEPRTLDSWWPKILRVLSKLGPGIVTVADDDPSGIATYSQLALNLDTRCSGRCSFPFH